MVAPDRYPHLAQLSRRDRPASRYSPNTQLARPQTYVRPQIQPLWPRSVYRERLTLATGTAVLPSPDSASIVREPTEGIGRIRPGNGPPGHLRERLLPGQYRRRDGFLFREDAFRAAGHPAGPRAGRLFPRQPHIGKKPSRTGPLCRHLLPESADLSDTRGPSAGFCPP